MAGKDFFWKILFVCIFLFLSLAYTCGRIGLHFKDYLLATSDAANIASFSAALDHPELFTNDPLLSNPSNFAYYQTLHIPLIRSLAKLFGNYSTPFAALIFPLTFLHLLGFYWLGWEVTQNKFMAFFFSIAVLIPVRLNLSEIWGLWLDMIPRFLFQSLLPFILAAVIKWGKEPKSWPWLLGATGLLVYAHPVSLPAWGLAVLFSLWFLAPAMPNKEKISRLFFAGLVFLIVITPFTINYLSTTTFGARGSIQYSEMIEIMRKRFITGFMDLDLAFKEFLKVVVFSDWLMVILWTFVFVGGLILFLDKKIHKDSIFLTLTGWWISIFLVSVAIPYVDQAIAYRLQRMPLEVDLVRNMRFSIPLLLLSVFYWISKTHSELIKTVPLSYKSIFMAFSVLLSALLLTGWIFRNDFNHNAALIQSAQCWSKAQLVCEFPEEQAINQELELLNAVKTITPPDSRIMAASDTSELVMRYFALRPLVYSYKDGAAFIYSNFDDLKKWWQQFKEISQLQSIDSRALFLDGFVTFVQKNNGQFLVLNEKFESSKYYPPSLENVFSNDRFSLFRVLAGKK